MSGIVGVLRIYCHGNASWIEVGPGLSVPSQATNFQDLRGCWVGRYPRVKIHARAVTSSTAVRCAALRAIPEELPRVCTAGTSTPGSPGAQLVQAIADNAGVLAIAAYNAQLGQVPGFEGNVIHCRPARYYTMDSLVAG